MHMRVMLTVTAALFLVGLASAGSAAAARSTASEEATTAKTYRVTVTMTEYRFKLSRSSFPAGSTVIFTVRNKGDELHDFYIQQLNKRTRYLKSGKSATLKVTFKKKGSYQYLCTVGEHAQRGMIGQIRVK